MPALILRFFYIYMAHTPPGTRQGVPGYPACRHLASPNFPNASSECEVHRRVRIVFPLSSLNSSLPSLNVPMSLPKKRGRSLDFDAIAEITKDDVGCKAAVRGVVTQLSPVKTGRKSKYYSGKIADNDAAIRFVSFASKKVDVPASFEVFEGFKAKKEAIQMKNCEVKVNSFTGQPELELHINSSTLFEKSSMTFDVSPESDKEDVRGDSVATRNGEDVRRTNIDQSESDQSRAFPHDEQRVNRPNRRRR